MSEQTNANLNDGFKYTNNQQSNNIVSLNVESRFGPNTNISLSSQLIDELIDAHKKSSRKQIIYVSIFFGIFVLVGLILFGVSYAVPECKDYIQNCARTRLVLWVIGLVFAGSFALLIPLVFCVWRCQLSCQLSDLNDPDSRDDVVVWRLEGEQWIQYLDYIHGPNRQWKEVAPLSSFCCRRGTYERLSDRQYGHIVLYRNGIFIDELYLVSFQTYDLRGVEIKNFDGHSPRLGLRVHTYLQAGRNSRDVYFDIFAPSSVTYQQLVTISQWYNQRVSGFNGLNMALGGLEVAASVIRLAS